MCMHDCKNDTNMETVCKHLDNTYNHPLSLEMHCMFGTVNSVDEQHNLHYSIVLMEEFNSFKLLYVVIKSWLVITI